MFADRLRLTLTLALGSATASFASGAIEEFDLHMRPYGFEARVLFRVITEQEDDPIFAEFVKDTLIQATLRVTSCVLDGTGEEPVAVEAKGYVLDKVMREQVSDDVQGQPVVERRYQVRFVDPAQAFWRQHRPVELLIGSSMQQAIDLYKTQGMELVYDWTRLGETQEVLCVAAEGPCSFYDLVVWYVDRFGGVLELDAATATYRFGSAKKRPSGQPSELEAEYVGKITLRPPEPPRHKVRLLNADAVAHSIAEVTNAMAPTGVSRDVLLRTPLASSVERRQQLESDRLRVEAHGLRIDLVRCPPELYGPGGFIQLSDEFSDRIYPSGRVYRVLEFHMQARPAEAGATAEPDDEARAFEVELAIELEVSSSPRVHLPRYTAPRYPILVEGKIISQGGGDEDRTWMTVLNEQDSIFRYQVDIPLWNKKVPAPFEPLHWPGHWFFPAYKGQRVLVALSFDGASVRRYLDWAANARLPAEGQGNRLVMGYQAANGTTIEHSYTDAKPVMTVARTFGNDLQTLVIKEGTLFLEVKEDTTQQALEPRYDVSVVVTASKERVGAEVQGAIGGLTGSFESSMGGVTASLEGALGELDGALSAAEGKVVSKIGEVDAKLEELSIGLSATTEAMTAAVAEAKAALEAALA